MGMRTISWTALLCQPALLAYISGLTAPSDNFIRRSLYHRCKHPHAAWTFQAWYLTIYAIIHFSFQPAEKAFVCSIIRWHPLRDIERIRPAAFTLSSQLASDNAHLCHCVSPVVRQHLRFDSVIQHGVNQFCVGTCTEDQLTTFPSK